MSLRAWLRWRSWGPVMKLLLRRRRLLLSLLLLLLLRRRRRLLLSLLLLLLLLLDSGAIQQLPQSPQARSPAMTNDQAAASRSGGPSCISVLCGLQLAGMCKHEGEGVSSCQSSGNETWCSGAGTD